MTRTVTARSAWWTTTTAFRVYLAISLIAVAVMVFWPTPVDRPIAGEINHAVFAARDAGVVGIISHGRIEALSNVAMFTPVGALLVLSLPRWPWWWAVVGTAALSGAIELTQELFLPARSGSVQDVVLNTAGGLLGALVGWYLRRRLLRRTATPA